MRVLSVKIRRQCRCTSPPLERRADQYAELPSMTKGALLLAVPVEERAAGVEEDLDEDLALG